jgi:hypothetical protein
MAYSLTAASSHALTGLFAPVTTEPLTMAFLYRLASTPTNRMAVSLGRSTGQGAFRVNITGTTMLAQRVDDTGAPNASSSTTVANTVGVWYHAAAVFLPSGSNVTGYINGVAGTPATNSGTTLSTLDRVVIGARLSAGTPGLYFDGEIAEVVMWNAALTADEIGALADNYRPDIIRPQNLVFYPDLIRTPRDRKSGAMLSVAGSPTITPHPRRIG